jgi:hypothetical protein
MKGVHWIDTGQWPSALAFVKDEAAYRRVMHAHCGKDCELRAWPHRDGGFCQQLADDTGKSVILIGMGKQKNKTEAALTAAHEATHAMRWILAHAAENEPGTETEAYLVEHIMRGVLNALAK